jgi:pimeloyl-ACP methyl ester carboxylesterase
MTKQMIVGFTALAFLVECLAYAQNRDKATKDLKGEYANVNGLKMYYEVHGTGRPLVLLHGAFGWATAYPSLAKNRQQIAVELQGHGHTADVDRVAINGSHFGKIEEAYEPETFNQFKSLPADFAPPVLKGPYDKVAPDPKQWSVLVAKVKKMGLEFNGFTREQMKSIKAPVLITLGDRDGVRPEHAVDMFRLIPNAQLAIFPGADHFLLFQDPEKLLPTVAAFLDASGPKAK